MEIILTLGVFLSSILVLSMEKNWWGGYLSMEESDDQLNEFRHRRVNMV